MKHIYILSCEKAGGIYHYLFRDGKLEFVDKTPSDRPMYAIIRDNRLYAVLREADTATRFGSLVSYDISANGSLVGPTATEMTNGLVPCHLEVLGNRQYIVNYLSGNLVKINGKTVEHRGKGVHPTRQEAPHTHCVCASPDQNHILCTDLGTDTVFVYDTDLNEEFIVKVPDGSGARHLCFSKDGTYLYCVNELSSDVSVFAWNHAKPILKGTYSARTDFKGQNDAAAIRIEGEYLYISNRGADTVSRFQIEGDRLVLLENTSCGGRGPRDFYITDGYMILANEKSNSITVMKLENGKPVLTDETTQINAPLCVIGGE